MKSGDQCGAWREGVLLEGGKRIENCVSGAGWLWGVNALLHK